MDKNQLVSLQLAPPCLQVREERLDVEEYKSLDTIDR